MIYGKTLALAFLLLATTALGAQAQSVRTRDVTSGACMVICDDVSFCRTIDYDRGTGTCTIFLKSADSGFKALQKRCPNVPPENWVISHANERWSIGCPPR